MNTLVWIAQIMLVLVFAGTGLLKTTQSRALLDRKVPWARGASLPLIRFIGTVELLGALGLILPGVVGRYLWLVPTAAAGLAVVMLLAVIFHIRRRELEPTITTIILLLMAVFVAWARFGPYPL